MITVFTPAYNRAHLLGRLYESLVAQTCRDFEWIVVDDGSTDDTRAIVAGFITEGKLNIRYYHQENGGKHRAINRGVKEARGELFFIVDSDDYLPENSINDILEEWQAVKDDSHFGGVSGYIGDFKGRYIGNGANAPERVDCNSLDVRYKYHVHGDLAEVFRTEVLREIPFPTVEGEKFCPEALVWNRIAQKYILRYFHKIIYYREYLSDGITAHMARWRMESPVASCTHYKELNGYDVPWKIKLRSAINYWRFYACLKPGAAVPRLPWWWFWTAPLGYVYHLIDRNK